MIMDEQELLKEYGRVKDQRAGEVIL